MLPCGGGERGGGDALPGVAAGLARGQLGRRGKSGSRAQPRDPPVFGRESCRASAHAAWAAGTRARQLGHPHLRFPSLQPSRNESRGSARLCLRPHDWALSLQCSGLIAGWRSNDGKPVRMPCPWMSPLSRHLCPQLTANRARSPLLPCLLAAAPARHQGECWVKGSPMGAPRGTARGPGLLVYFRCAAAAAALDRCIACLPVYCPAGAPPHGHSCLLPLCRRSSHSGRTV